MLLVVLELEKEQVCTLLALVLVLIAFLLVEQSLKAIMQLEEGKRNDQNNGDSQYKELEGYVHASSTLYPMTGSCCPAVVPLGLTHAAPYPPDVWFQYSEKRTGIKNSFIGAEKKRGKVGDVALGELRFPSYTGDRRIIYEKACTAPICLLVLLLRTFRSSQPGATVDRGDAGNLRPHLFLCDG